MNETNRKEWYLYTKRADFTGLAERLGVSPLMVKIMRNRDLTAEEEMRTFLTGGLSDLYDPALLPDAEKAAELIAEKIRKERTIRIVGDYDIDGVCSTYILFDALRQLGARVSFTIPDRIRDGYGLNRRIVEEAIHDQVDTIITCDNGISALEEMKLAKEHGLTVVLTDHHDLRKDEDGKDILPVADCVVNVRRSDSRYPEKALCGAVTAWKLVQLVQKQFQKSPEDWLKYLEFAALATVGDVMPLTGENRIIVSEGLSAMHGKINNPGLAALVQENNLDQGSIGTYHLGFIIGPCINAGGRLETARTAMALFMSDSEEEARRRAVYLKGLNEERKEQTRKGTEEAKQKVIESYAEDKVLVIYQEGLHESLAGIVAGRIRETFGRPCYVLTPSGPGGESQPESVPEVKGSGRSMECYNMFRKLTECDDLLLKYGGHPMAAGLSLRKENVDALRTRLNDSCDLTEQDLIEKKWIDAVMPLAFVHSGLVEELKKLEPFGPGNARPVFACKNVRLMQRRVLGKSRNMLKMEAMDEKGTRITASMFGDADEIDRRLEEKPFWDILYYPQINDFRGMHQLEIRLEDIR